MPSRRQHRPDPPPLETNDVTIVAVGTAAWAIGLVVLLVMELTGSEVQTWWLAMCGYGVALGLFGVRYTRRRHAALDRDAAKAASQHP